MEQLTERSEDIRIHGAARTSKGTRGPENQDAVGFFPELFLYAVADGVGGRARGTVASSLSIEAIRCSLLQTGDEDLTPVIAPTGQASLDGRRLLLALHDANDRVRDASLNDPRLHGMAAAVAAVLSWKPDVLILDEPTAGLDAQGKEVIVQLMRSLHATGRTTIIISHDVDLALEECTSAGILDQGRLVRAGPPATMVVDDLLLRVGLALPEVTQVVRHLNAIGWPVSSAVASVSRACTEIVDVLS